MTRHTNEGKWVCEDLSQQTSLRKVKEWGGVASREGLGEVVVKVGV